MAEDNDQQQAEPGEEELTQDQQIAKEELEENEEISDERVARYEDVDNQTLAEVLAGHRLVRVYLPQKRHNGLGLPNGYELRNLIRHRLLGVNPPAEAPESEPNERMTKEAAIAQLKGVETFDELLNAYRDLLNEKAPQAENDADVNQEIGELRSRVLTQIETDRLAGEPPVPTEQEISQAMISRYESVSSLDGLQTELAKDQPQEVQHSVTEMMDRVRASANPTETTPAT